MSSIISRGPLVLQRLNVLWKQPSMRLASRASPAAVTISVLPRKTWPSVTGNMCRVLISLIVSRQWLQFCTAAVSCFRYCPRRSCAIDEFSAKKHVVAQRLVPGLSHPRQQ